MTARPSYGPNAPVEWTTLGGLAPGARRGALPTSQVIRAAARGRTAGRRHRADTEVRGVAVPYNVVLPGHGGERLIFTPATDWALSDEWIQLQLEHGAGYVGVAHPVEHDSGLLIDGRLFAERRAAIAGRSQLSVGLTGIRTRRCPDGVLEVLAARLEEISVVRHARWSPHTFLAAV